MKKLIAVFVVMLLMVVSVAAAEDKPFIALGDYNGDVIALHQKLYELGYYELRAESPWSAASENAVMILQENMGWEITGAVEDEARLQEILALDHVIGKNLLADTDYCIEKDSSSTAYEAKGFSLSSDVDMQSLLGKTVTISIYVNSPGERGTSMEDTSHFMVNRFGCHMTVIWADSTGTLEDKTTYPCTELLSQTVEDTRISTQYTFNAPDGYDSIKSVGVSLQSGARPAEGNNAVWKLGYPKLEYGCVATDWIE